ncbi:MAG: hypothetical protein HND48_08175 [Chloroflexi bacterium]|nr:hypothetical protein [Chloroflexota bacterium]
MRHVEVYVFSGRRSGRRWRHDRTAYRAHLLQHIRRYLIRVVADGMVEIGGRLGAQRLIPARAVRCRSAGRHPDSCPP